MFSADKSLLEPFPQHSVTIQGSIFWSQSLPSMARLLQSDGKVVILAVPALTVRLYGSLALEIDRDKGAGITEGHRGNQGGSKGRVCSPFVHLPISHERGGPPATPVHQQCSPGELKMSHKEPRGRKKRTGFPKSSKEGTLRQKATPPPQRATQRATQGGRWRPVFPRECHLGWLVQKHLQGLIRLPNTANQYERSLRGGEQGTGERGSSV
jgi:hypothetical protein